VNTGRWYRSTQPSACNVSTTEELRKAAMLCTRRRALIRSAASAVQPMQADNQANGHESEEDGEEGPAASTTSPSAYLTIQFATLLWPKLPRKRGSSFTVEPAVNSCLQWPELAEFKCLRPPPPEECSAMLKAKLVATWTFHDLLHAIYSTTYRNRPLPSSADSWSLVQFELIVAPPYMSSQTQKIVSRELDSCIYRTVVVRQQNVVTFTQISKLREKGRDKVLP